MKKVKPRLATELLDDIASKIIGEIVVRELCPERHHTCLCTDVLDAVFEIRMLFSDPTTRLSAQAIPDQGDRRLVIVREFCSVWFRE